MNNVIQTRNESPIKHHDYHFQERQEPLPLKSVLKHSQASQSVDHLEVKIDSSTNSNAIKRGQSLGLIHETEFRHERLERLDRIKNYLREKEQLNYVR